MLLDRDSLHLAPGATGALESLAGDGRFKLELPASQLEIVTAPTETVSEACRLLLAARRDLAQGVGGQALLASAGVHPFSPGSGELNALTRYEDTISEYGGLARRQLVCAFQVHVAPGGAERALAVYNAARPYLPLIAALAANAPFYEGRDSGLASVRPKLCEMLPRQGVPPALPSWNSFSDALAWGKASGSFRPGAWWWELRPHRQFGTLEFRVPDGQSSVAGAAAVAAVVQALVAWLGENSEDRKRPDEWRIAENRWSACRHGVDGQMADLETGIPRPTRACLHELLDELGPVADGLGCSAQLRLARGLVERNGALAQREVAAEQGMTGLARWLTERFVDPLPM